MKKEHELFIAQMKEHGHKRRAYQAAYPGVTASGAYTGATRLMAIPEIAAQLEGVVVNSNPEKQKEPTVENDVFVREYLKDGDARRAYATAYPGASAKTITRGVNRMFNNPAIKERLAHFREKIEHAAIAALADDLKLTMASYAQKRHILWLIMEGKIKIKKTVCINGIFEEVEVLPDYTDRMRAINLDNRMAGDYSPEKIKVETIQKVFTLELNGKMRDY